LKRVKARLRNELGTKNHKKTREKTMEQQERNTEAQMKSEKGSFAALQELGKRITR
jgi:hypothetical protein